MIHRTEEAKNMTIQAQDFVSLGVLPGNLIKRQHEVHRKDQRGRGGRVALGSQVRSRQRVCQGCSISTEVRIRTTQNVHSALTALKSPAQRSLQLPKLHGECYLHTSHTRCLSLLPLLPVTHHWNGPRAPNKGFLRFRNRLSGEKKKKNIQHNF